MKVVPSQQSSSQTSERTLDSRYSSTTAPSPAIVIPTRDGIAWENEVFNRGKENDVSQSGRKNRNWNDGDENQVKQDSKDYEQMFKLATLVLVVGIVSWTVVRYSNKI